MCSVKFALIIGENCAKKMRRKKFRMRLKEKFWIFYEIFFQYTYITKYDEILI